MMFYRTLRPEAAPAIHQPQEDIDRATDILARTIWGEARGERLAGKEAVANVIMNRARLSKARGKFWWGNDVIGICTAYRQFSCWNENDPNYQKILAVGSDNKIFAMCRRIARRAMQGFLEDNTFGADHYHAASITPAWTEDRLPTAQIGNHIFYKLEG